MFELKLSATDKVIPFLLVSSADHINGVTGLTPTVEISKNGSGFAAPAGWSRVSRGVLDCEDQPFLEHR